MVSNIFSQINYWAVLLAGIVFWLVGMLWFSALIGKHWSEEIRKHGIKLSKLDGREMAVKSVVTFILNLIAALGVAFVLTAAGVSTGWGGIVFGLILGLFIAAASMITSHLWENRSARLSFYDIFYPFIGILISSIIIALWR